MVKTSKKCNNCRTLKDIQSFPIDKRRTDGHAYRCKECQKILAKIHYQKNKHKYQVTSKQHRFEKRLFIYNYKLAHPCIDCGEKDPIVLDFDHRNPEDKNGNISRMATNRTTIKKLEREIAKCDVRCANCHRRRTAKQFDWYKNIS
jgi:hypothetical protein